MCLEGASRAGATSSPRSQTQTCAPTTSGSRCYPPTTNPPPAPPRTRFAHPPRHPLLGPPTATSPAAWRQPSPSTPAAAPPPATTHRFAWDIYLAYPRGNADINAPDFWMHQLAIDHAPRFDAAEWRRHNQHREPARTPTRPRPLLFANDTSHPRPHIRPTGCPTDTPKPLHRPVHHPRPPHDILSPKRTQRPAVRALIPRCPPAARTRRRRSPPRPA